MKKLQYVFLLLITVIIFTLFFTSCQPKEEEIVVTVTPTPTLPADQAAVWEAWQGSAHADTYDREKGPNTYCARCHSPTNWDYSAKIDPPPNCVSCKLPNETEPRIAVNNSLVPEEEWGDIGCEVCHQMNGRLAEPGYYWYDNATGYHEVVDSTTELCEKCHKDQGSFLHHQVKLGAEVHQGYTCTDCHDPHDSYASCGNCHLEIVQSRMLATLQHVNLTDKSQCLVCHPIGMDAHSMEIQREGETNCLVCHDYLANVSEDEIAPIYHSKVHEAVECIGCHAAAAADIEVGKVEGADTWTMFRTVKSPFGMNSEAYSSHNLTKNVECTRCHDNNNPWNLPEVQENP